MAATAALTEGLEVVDLRALAAPQPEAGEAVAWQRNHPVRGWIDCAHEDTDHYRSVGQDIRALGVIAPPSVQPVEGK